MFFGPSKRDKQILGTVSDIVVKQFKGILEIQWDTYGVGINFLMVGGKFFETEWLLGYISGWFEGYVRALKLSEKYWKQAIENALGVTESCIQELYKHEGMKINWLRIVQKKGKTQNYLEGLEAGLTEGSASGQHIKSWIDDGIFPTDQTVMFGSLEVKLRQGNNLSVLTLQNDARDGDVECEKLLKQLKLM